MDLACPWNQVEEALANLVERHDDTTADEAAQASLEHLGLAEENPSGALVATPRGHRYHLARFVRQDDEAVAEVLAEILVDHPIPNGFCEVLWPVGEMPKDGAVRMLVRLLPSSSDSSGKRWLELMNKAGLIVYNRAAPTVRVLYNPSDLAPPEEEAERERRRAHLLSPDTPFQNLLSLKDVLRATKGWIRWYERHLPGEVLEVLHREIQSGQVESIRLLSGPANIDAHVQDLYVRARREWKARRGIDLAWRVLSHSKSGEHHDRFLLSEDLSRNLPPLNSILRGSTSEITVSELTAEEFDEWWAEGQDLSEREF